MKQFEQILLLVSIISTLVNSSCVTNPANDMPIIDKKPILLQTSSNGQKYVISEGTNVVYILNLRGSPKEMGIAYGQLMSKEIQANINGMVQYMGDEFIELLAQKMPRFLAKSLTRFGLLNGLLDLNYEVSRRYTPQRYKEEMKGIAQGSRVSYRNIRRVNIFPEFIRAACTIVGAWGKATPDGKVIQLRALDFDPNTPLNQYPTAVVYHSSQAGSQVFANIGFAGLIGTLSAQSAAGIGISEKVWLPKKEEGAHYTYLGKPWAYVLRDLAQFETTIIGAINTLNKTHRTMRIHIGLGSAADNSFRGVQYAHNRVQVFDDENYTYTDAHPQLEGVMFFDKHPQPSSDSCVGDILKSRYGNITNEVLFQEVVGKHNTGDAHWAVYDLHAKICYMSFAEYRTGYPAHQRSPIFVDFKPFFQSSGATIREYNNGE